MVARLVSIAPGSSLEISTITEPFSMRESMFRVMRNSDGEEETCIRDGYYRRALTIYRGLLTHEETSAVQGKPWVRPEEALGISGFRLDPAPLASDTHSTHFYSWAEDGGAQTEHSS